MLAARPLFSAVALVGALFLCAVNVPLRAQQHVTIYRCTDAAGAVLIQNDQPCPDGHREQTQVIDVPPPMPAHVPRAVRMPEVVAAEAAAAEAAVAAALPKPLPVAERTAPPALFECTTWENTTFLTEDETPAERCAPMRVVGLDGRPRPRMGSACQTTRDQCTPVPEDGLCGAWKRRVDEAEFRWKFAREPAGSPKHIAYAQLTARFANSTCAAGGARERVSAR